MNRENRNYFFSFSFYTSCSTLARSHSIFYLANSAPLNSMNNNGNLIAFRLFPFSKYIGRADKLDNSFTRSRSSSMSSLENITSESVTCLAFVDSYTKKSGKLTFSSHLILIRIFLIYQPIVCNQFRFRLRQLLQFISISQQFFFSILLHHHYSQLHKLWLVLAIELITQFHFFFVLQFSIIDPSTLIPTLWLGTSLGSVLTVSITLPEAESRNTSPVLVSILGELWPKKMIPSHHHHQKKANLKLFLF
jgi:hypothetical protein